MRAGRAAAPESCNLRLKPGNWPGMNRIVAKFAELKAAGKKGLVVYIGAGDPNLDTTRKRAQPIA